MLRLLTLLVAEITFPGVVCRASWDQPVAGRRTTWRCFRSARTLGSAATVRSLGVLTNTMITRCRTHLSASSLLVNDGHLP